MVLKLKDGKERGVFMSSFMKHCKKLLTLVLAFVMLSNVSLYAYANSVTDSTSETSNSVVVNETGVYINDAFYTQEQFIQLLDMAQEIDTPQSYSATWFIPGIGEVVISAAGTIMVAGAVIQAGSWIYNAITDWFATRAFNKSAEDAVNGCNSNKQNHIMNPKHNWNKFNKNPKWSDVAPILIKVLKEGKETWEKNNQYIRTLVYKGETVVVRFLKDADGLEQNIGTAWCK